jgi:hypothetical protein
MAANVKAFDDFFAGRPRWPAFLADFFRPIH